MKRVRAKDSDDEAAPSDKGGGNYFADEKPMEFIPTGCRVLDCVVSGGWPLGRISNIVGDESTGKTLLAIEAAANFAERYKRGSVWYREAEAAFDQKYAAALGMPMDRVDFGKKRFETVEDIYEDMFAVLERCKSKNEPALYVVDSLDALSDEAELARDFNENTYGGTKPKQIGQLLRRLAGDIEQARMHVMIISQLRDKIGVTFGEKKSRSGGKALNFYASQVVWLAHKEDVKRTIKKVERVTGVRIRARCKKNKIGLPRRECEFVINFGYGVDDLRASVEFLDEMNRLGDLTTFDAKKYLAACDTITSDHEYRTEVIEAGDIAGRVWRELDRQFLPKRTKYGKAEP